MLLKTNISFVRHGLAALALALLAPMGAHGQTISDVLTITRQAPATGARMMGMAGAGTAGLEDYAAFTYNPAALGYYQHSEVAGSFYGFSATNEAVFRLPGGNTSPLDENTRNYGLGNLAYIYKVPTQRGSFVVGGGINEVNNYARELSFEGVNDQNTLAEAYIPAPKQLTWDVNLGPDGELDGENDLNPDDEYTVNGLTNPFALLLFDTYALDIAYDNFEQDPATGGVTLNGDLLRSPLASVQQSGTLTEEGSRYEANLGSAIEVASDVMMGASVNVIFGSYSFTNIYEEENAGDSDEANFEYLELTDRIEDDFSGANGRLGVSARIVEGLRGGLMLETPTYYSIKETYSTELYAESEGLSDTYGDDNDENFASGEFEYQITTPWQLGAGLAFSAGRASISGDLTFVDWSQLELSSDTDRNTFDNLNQNISQNLDIALNARFGGEYRFKQLSARAGFAYQPDPFQSDLTSSDGESFDKKRLFYSAGVGYRLSNRLELDAAWMQERFEDQYSPYTVAGGGRGPVADEQIARNRFVIGLRYAF